MKNYLQKFSRNGGKIVNIIYNEDGNRKGNFFCLFKSLKLRMVVIKNIEL